MCLAPRALVHASLGQRPREKLLPQTSAESANQCFAIFGAEDMLMMTLLSDCAIAE
jgi:hypothetical protein